MDMTHTLDWVNLKDKLILNQDLFINYNYNVILTKKPQK